MENFSSFTFIIHLIKFISFFLSCFPKYCNLSHGESVSAGIFVTMRIDRGLIIFGFLAVFLALAPFYPEPHLVGKIRWVMGGANGMTEMDWFDLFLHGLPIMSFLFLLGFQLGRKKKATESKIIRQNSTSKKEIAA